MHINRFRQRPPECAQRVRNTTGHENKIVYDMHKEHVIFHLRETCSTCAKYCSYVTLLSGHMRDEVTGGWRRLRNKELYALHSSPNIIRVIKSRRLRLAENVASTEERRVAYGTLVGKLEGRRPLERPRCTWEDNIKMGLREVG